MADLFDRFTGSAGVLTSHTADSGDTWGPSGNTDYQLSGSGAAYGTAGGFVWGGIAYSSWTPPGTDYQVDFVLGANIPTNWYGPCARCSGANGSTSGYFLQVTSTGLFGALYQIVAGNPTQIGSNFTAPYAATNDTFSLQVSGSGATVTLTVLYNGTQLYQTTDTSAARITAAGSAGFLDYDNANGNDVVRTIWAGAIGGPSAGISPSSASVSYGGTQTFSATDLLPNETADWTATSGSVSPSSGSSTVYTAPMSGSSATVTWTSADLPTHTASASVSLSGSASWLVIENMAVGSPSPIQVVSSSASSGPRTVVVTGWPASWTSFPMILTATRSGALLGNLEATAYDSGTTTLTISGVTGDYTDFALDANDVFQNRVCVEVIRQIQSGVDSVASSLNLLGTINAQTGTSYTLALSDAGQFVTLSNASAITLTVPPNSSVAFPVSTVINLAQTGAGQVTVAPGSGVTIDSYDGHTNLAGEYASGTLKKTATNTWLLMGNLA